MSIKALLVGISDYSALGIPNLPFCKNDINIITEALSDGLAASKENIIVLGKNNIVNVNDFKYKLNCMIPNVNEDDTFIFYFSGHGGNYPEHYLAFSDNLLNTQNIIKYLDAINCRNKLIILDSCKSGNVAVEETYKINSTTYISDFFGKGYAVISSSNATQSSYGHPTKKVSLFTSYLYEALMSETLIKNGNKSLHDIQKRLSLYLDIWNKNNPDLKQKPIFNTNIGGTILFPVKPYKPYLANTYHYETSDYIIYTVEPTNSPIAKRYSAKIILKTPMSFDEIAIINHEIVKKVINLDIYKNTQAEIRWKNKPANIIFCYYALDEFDIFNSNYFCHTTWVDNTQDKNWWYKKSSNSEIINDIHFTFNSYYETLKIFQKENTGSYDSVIKQTKEIINYLILASEKIINYFNKFLNETISEDKLIEKLKPLSFLIEEKYSDISELNLSPKELKDWSWANLSLAGTIHDFTLFYNDHALSTRSAEDRKNCMKIAIDRYLEDLKKVKDEEQNINLE